MKKVFLSLAALAFVATGAVSCSSDDGGSDGGGQEPVLTENFISVDGVQIGAEESRWYVRTDGAGGDAPIVEYNLAEEGATPELYAIFDLVTFGEGESLVNYVYAVKIDESKSASEEGRYYFPFTSEEFGTYILAGYYSSGSQNYEFNDDMEVNLEAMDYGTGGEGTITYTSGGTLSNSSEVEVDVNGVLKSLYILDVSGSSANSVSSYKGSLDNVSGERQMIKSTHNILK